MKKIFRTVGISKAQDDYLKRCAERHGCSVAAFIRYLINQRIEQENKKYYSL